MHRLNVGINRAQKKANLKNQHDTIKQLLEENKQLRMELCKKGEHHWIVQFRRSTQDIWLDFSVGNFKWEAILAYETEYGMVYDQDRKNGFARCIKVFESA